MKVYQEIFININGMEAPQFIEVARAFCGSSTNWDYLEEQSEHYSDNAGCPSLALLFTAWNGKLKPSVLITKDEHGVYYVSNIVSSTSGSFSKDEYNFIAKRFGLDFRRYIKSFNVPITLKIPSVNKSLRHIIKSKVARDAFNAYLSQNPLSHHPLDIQRLDIFTCILFRRAREKVNFDYFERYLLEDLNWQPEQARWCRNRVETGWEVLEMDRHI